SERSALDAGGIGGVATNTTLAAAAGGLAAMFFLYPRVKKWDMGITINGFLAGLVAITCPCYWVNQLGAVIIGSVAGVLVVLAVDLLEWVRIDDPIGAWPVHGVCGIWGTLSLGLFATGQYFLPGPNGADTSNPVTGLFYGGGGSQLWAQFVGSFSVTLAVVILAVVMMYIVKLTRTLRVPEAGELE